MSLLPASLLSAIAVALALPAAAQPCPDRNLSYWQAFPPGGESDISGRQQQAVLKKKCPAVDIVMQYKAGGGGAVLWSSLNTLPGDGTNIAGINLPHMVLQPMEGNVQYKLDDVTPVFWFHYTPDALVVREDSPIRSWADFLKAAQAAPGRLNVGGSALNSANHAAHERMNAAFKVSSNYVPFKGTGDMTIALLGGHLDAAMTYSAFAINNKGKARALAVAMDKRHPLMPDVPTFRELGVDWVDGAFRGIGVPKSTPPEARRKLAEIFAALNADPEMKEMAARSGFELISIGPDRMEAFMRERAAVYTEVGRRMGLGKK